MHIHVTRNALTKCCLFVYLCMRFFSLLSLSFAMSSEYLPLNCVTEAKFSRFFYDWNVKYYLCNIEYDSKLVNVFGENWNPFEMMRRHRNVKQEKIERPLKSPVSAWLTMKIEIHNSVIAWVAFSSRRRFTVACIFKLMFWEEKRIFFLTQYLFCLAFRHTHTYTLQNGKAKRNNNINGEEKKKKTNQIRINL